MTSRFFDGARRLGLMGLTMLAAHAAETALPATEAARMKQRAADEAFEVRRDYILATKGNEAAFQLIEKEFARDPRPHLKARYAECLLEGKTWGASDGRAEEGLKLAHEALDQGSDYALSVVGWQLVTGRLETADSMRGIGYIRRALDAGYPEASLRMGDVFLVGLGVATSPTLAESFFRRAAHTGQCSSLYRLAEYYENGKIGNAPDLTKAADLYYEAAYYGDGTAFKHLRALVDRGVPEAVRGYDLAVLWLAEGGNGFTTPTIRKIAAEVEARFPEDPVALIALGRIYRESRSLSGFGVGQVGNYGLADVKKSVAFFAKAMALGSDDAGAEWASMVADGRGVKKDPAAALAEWRALEPKGNALALSWLGYYQHWASLDGLPKDRAKAFTYSKAAADGGEVYAQLRTAECYAFGVGTEKNYAAAAKYYLMAGRSGFPYALKEAEKILRFIEN